MKWTALQSTLHLILYTPNPNSLTSGNAKKHTTVVYTFRNFSFLITTIESRQCYLGGNNVYFKILSLLQFQVVSLDLLHHKCNFFFFLRMATGEKSTKQVNCIIMASLIKPAPVGGGQPPGVPSCSDLSWSYHSVYDV